MHIVFDPARFRSFADFTRDVSNSIREINAMPPAPGFSAVLVPGQSSARRVAAYEKDGIEIVDHIHEYLESDVIHNNNYDGKGVFAK